jgi:hypothetical protein
MIKSEFIKALDPLLRLGPKHPHIDAVITALDVEWKQRCIEATGNGHTAEERAWWSGAATIVRDLKVEIENDLQDRVTAVE